jgi:hypothetical protein
VRHPVHFSLAWIIPAPSHVAPFSYINTFYTYFRLAFIRLSRQADLSIAYLLSSPLSLKNRQQCPDKPLWGGKQTKVEVHGEDKDEE